MALGRDRLIAREPRSGTVFASSPGASTIIPRSATMAATTITPGDTVEVLWLETQRPSIGIVEMVEFGAVRVFITGPPPIFVYCTMKALREAGPGRWQLDL